MLRNEHKHEHNQKRNDTNRPPRLSWVLACHPPSARDSVSNFKAPRRKIILPTARLTMPRLERSELGMSGARLALTASLPRCACAVTHFVEGRFAHMTFKEQLYAVSRSCALVGAHGAGMTHVLFMPPDARVLEMRTPGFHRHHFEACVTSTTSVQRGWWRIGAHPCACVCMCGQVFAVGWVAIRKVGHIKLIAGPEYSGFEALIGALTATRRPYSALAALTRALCCHSY